MNAWRNTAFCRRALVLSILLGPEVRSLAPMVPCCDGRGRAAGPYTSHSRCDAAIFCRTTRCMLQLMSENSLMWFKVGICSRMQVKYLWMGPASCSCHVYECRAICLIECLVNLFGEYKNYELSSRVSECKRKAIFCGSQSAQRRRG